MTLTRLPNKFRAYDDDNNCLRYGYFIEVQEAKNMIIELLVEGWEVKVKTRFKGMLSKCLGLKDKYGKEIFEGDLVRSENDRGMIGIDYVPFLTEAWHGELPFHFLSDLQRNIDTAEVIGNVRENRDLIPPPNFISSDDND